MKNFMLCDSEKQTQFKAKFKMMPELIRLEGLFLVD